MRKRKFYERQHRRIGKHTEEMFKLLCVNQTKRNSINLLINFSDKEINLNCKINKALSKKVTRTNPKKAIRKIKLSLSDQGYFPFFSFFLITITFK